MFWSAVLLAGMALLLVTALSRLYIAYLDRVAGEVRYSPLLITEITYSLIVLVRMVIRYWGDIGRFPALVLLGVGTLLFALDMAWVRRDERRFQAIVARYITQAKDE